jgi:hypothetical protein
MTTAQRPLSIKELSKITNLTEPQVSSWYYWQEKNKKDLATRQRVSNSNKFELVATNRGKELSNK